jgi:hypothetical protein
MHRSMFAAPSSTFLGIDPKDSNACEGDEGFKEDP